MSQLPTGSSEEISTSFSTVILLPDALLPEAKEATSISSSDESIDGKAWYKEMWLFSRHKRNQKEVVVGYISKILIPDIFSGNPL